MKEARNLVLPLFTIIACFAVICSGASTPTRRVSEGASIPEFSAIDTTGKPFSFKPSGGKVLALAFLSSEKKRSKEAVNDIFEVLSGIPPDKLKSLQVAFVMQRIDDMQFIESIKKETQFQVRILDDNNYNIWGKFGVIATPTILLSDSKGKVLCVKAGHTFDFASTVKSKLFQALEIPYDVDSHAGSTVRTVTNNTISAKAKRHLQMARSLSRKGRIATAIKQARIAYEIDPNLPEVVLELGELFCRSGQAQKAIKLVSDATVETTRDKARINLILGWANRQMGNLDKAEKFLQEGISQDAMLHRLFFELGRVYQQRNDSEKAMKAYFRALQLIYGED